MLSYRHGFHAGNHADVIKHFCQMLILEKLCDKAKPFVYIDTHSGAGQYHLDSEQARKTGEYKSGVSRVIDASFDSPTLQRYQQLLKEHYQRNNYPGSPAIAAKIAREQDVLHCIELHNSEIDNLRANLTRDTRVHIHHRDGFEGLVALLPPTPKRGLVLIDPPYELANEYNKLLKSMAKSLNRWANGIYAIWYPLLGERGGEKQSLSEQMVEAFSSLNCKNVLNFRLCPEHPDSHPGMYGSGMAIINAPFLLDEQLATGGKELLSALSTNAQGEVSVEWIKRGD